jgi:hypothetical protein
MPEHLKPEQPPSNSHSLPGDSLRLRSRSPHPYHRQQFEITYASEKLSIIGPRQRPLLLTEQNSDYEVHQNPSLLPEGFREPAIPNSDSGTEADDEHILKGLPAPKLRPHKGLRGAEGTLSSTPSPLLSPVILEGDIQSIQANSRRAAISAVLYEEDIRKAVERYRHKRQLEIVRRTTEAAILLFVGAILGLNREVRQLLRLWKKGIYCFAGGWFLTDGSRIIVPGSRHNFSNCNISYSITALHRTCATMEEAISSAYPSSLRSCAPAVPTCHYDACLHASIRQQPQ